MDWGKNKERNQKIVELYDNTDLTYSQIGERFCISRNAVSGVVWRAKNPEKYKKYCDDRNRQYRIDQINRVFDDGKNM